MSHEADDTVIYPGRLIRVPRAAVIAVCLLAAAASGALIAWRVSPPVSPPPAALQSLNCGAAAFSGAGLNAEPPGALRCFGAAARRCKAGSVKITEMGPDSGTYYWFTIESGGDGCQVIELRQYYSASAGAPAQPVTSTRCRVAAVTGTGVALRCDGQELLIPAAACVTWPSGCELVLSDSVTRRFSAGGMRMDRQ